MMKKYMCLLMLVFALVLSVGFANAEDECEHQYQAPKFEYETVNDNGDANTHQIRWYYTIKCFKCGHELLYFDVARLESHNMEYMHDDHLGNLDYHIFYFQCTICRHSSETISICRGRNGVGCVVYQSVPIPVYVE